MSDLINFRNYSSAEKPYVYITASLDLSGMLAGETLYFNQDNSTAYLSDPYYNGFITLDENVLVGDVLIRTSPPIVLFPRPRVANVSTGNTYIPVTCGIGAAESLGAPVELLYCAPQNWGVQTPPQYNGALFTVEQLNANPISYFGHTAARFPYGVTNTLLPDTRTNLRYLGVTFYSDGVRLPVGTPLVESGTIHVTLKVYPKTS